MINWHRLFGLLLMDFFTDSPYVVELEKDLSLRQQFLDVVILRKEQGDYRGELPDGLDNLRDHNLLSYKSLHEPFDDWALKELAGHYVNYRKQVSPIPDQLLPETHFQLYGVSTRFPEKLHRRLPLRQLKPGVYEIAWGTDNIRMIVLSELATGQHNAVLRLFSAQREAVIEAQRQYRMRQPDVSTVVQQLFDNYRLENLDMPYTMQDFQKDYVREHLNVLSPDEVLKRFSPDDRLKGLSSDEVLKRFSPDDRLKNLSPDDRLKGLSPDDIVNHLSPTELKKLLEQLKRH
ncbi:MAG: hypothetical protein EPN21_20695 [Methylococcaceae bacterium]|nr:MAG: hypothetical protein EPN21_20695 [Methylococcaceae bacterium]